MSNADRIAAALADLESQVVPNYSAAAKKHGVVRTTLMRRYTGKTVSNHEATTEHRQALNATQEKVLLEHVQRLVTRGIPSTPAIVRNFAEEIYGGRLGRCWTTRFIHRHEMHLKTMYLRNIDSLRKKSEYAPYFRLFYELFTLAVKKYRITGENIYNFDEKKFMIGVGIIAARVMTHEELKSGEIIGSSQDNNQE